MSKLIYEKETYLIKQACIEIKENLGNGFLEKVYENALKYELELRKFNVQQQIPLKIYYKEIIIGEYISDLIVNDKIIIELKAVEHINDFMKAQVINYLKATKIKLGLLINFRKNQPGFEFERLINI